MKNLKQFLLSRRTVIAQILLILAAIFAGYIFPQKFTTTSEQLDKWHEAYPFMLPWMNRLGLDHVYTTPWFAALLLLFLITLIISTAEQVKLSYRKTLGPGAAPDSEGVILSLDRESIIGTIRNAGYVPVYQDDSSLRFIRYRWGYWGNVLLHSGMAVVILASLMIVATEKRGLVHLVEGETFSPGSNWLIEESGILGGSLILPEAVRLDKSVIEFWETDEVKYQTTEFSFIGADGNEMQRTVGINLNLNDKGIRIYQGRDFGEAFYVTFTEQGGKEIKYIFQIDHPVKRDKPGYRNFSVEEIPFLIKIKYFADAERRSIQSADPLLVIRLVQKEQSLGGITQGDGGRLKLDIVDREKVAAEVSLRKGERKPLGPYTAELVHSAKWAGLIFVKNTGMPGVFAGFLVIVIGGTLSYFFPPREIFVRKDKDVFRLTWRAFRFKSLYEDEFEKIAGLLQGMKKQ